MSEGDKVTSQLIVNSEQLHPAFEKHGRESTAIVKTFALIHDRHTHTHSHAYRVVSFWREREDGVPSGDRLDVLSEDKVGTALAIMGCTEIIEAKSLIDRLRSTAGDQKIDLSDYCLE